MDIGIILICKTVLREGCRCSRAAIVDSDEKVLKKRAVLTAEMHGTI